MSTLKPLAATLILGLTAVNNEIGRRLFHVVKNCIPGASAADFAGKKIPRETLIKSFDKLRMNGNLLIPFVVSLSNHARNKINQRFPSG